MSRVRVPAAGDFRGRWKLADGNELRLEREGAGEEAAFRATPIKAERGALVVSVSQGQKDQRVVTRNLRLSGKWQADEKNRLAFFVDGASGPQKALTFSGSWASDRAGELTYSLKRTALKTRSRVERTLRFDGKWSIAPDRSLVYALEKSGEEALRFRGAFQTDSILAKKGEIRYQLGVEAAGEALSLFGKWKTGRDLSLEFDMGRSGNLRFGAVYRLHPERRITASLLAHGAPLGAEVVFERDTRAGNLFLRLRREAGETLAEAGATVRW